MRRLLLLAGVLALTVPASGSGRPSAYATVTGSKRGAGVAQFNVLPGGGLALKSPPKLGPAVGLGGIALTPNGLNAYVPYNTSNPGTGPTTLGRAVFQYSINRLTGKLSRKRVFRVASGLAPTGVVVAPNGRHAYVANSSSNTISQYRVGLGGRLFRLSPAAARTGQAPLDVAVSPNGRNAYAANTNEGDTGVTQYTVRPNGTLAPKSPAAVDANQPSNIALTPNGRSAYAPVLEGVEQYDVAPGTGKLTPKTPSILPVGSAPDGAAVTPDGTSAYVGSESAIAQFDVDRVTGRLTPKLPPTVPVPGETLPSVGDLVVSADGRTLYAAAACCAKIFEFSISAFDGTLSPKSPSSVGSIGTGVVIALAPDAPTAVLTVGRSGRTVRFDASPSYDLGAGIARYTWGFGDGSGLASGPHRAVHRYRRPGRYRASLMLTSTQGCTSGELVSTGHTVLCTGARARLSRLVVVR